MTAQPDNAALIDAEALPRARKVLALSDYYVPRLPAQWFAEARAFARDVLALAAALAAAERDYLELGDELATELADERHLHNETLSKLAAAEERAQAAEAANSNLADSREAWQALAETFAGERDAAEAQVRELREALAEFQRADLKGLAWPNDWLGPCFCWTMPTHWPDIKRGHEPRCLRLRAVLARSAGRAET